MLWRWPPFCLNPWTWLYLDLLAPSHLTQHWWQTYWKRPHFIQLKWGFCQYTTWNFNLSRCQAICIVGIVILQAELQSNKQMIYIWSHFELFTAICTSKFCWCTDYALTILFILSDSTIQYKCVCIEAHCNGLTHWSLGNLDAILKIQFSILFLWWHLQCLWKYPQVNATGPYWR